MKYILTGLLYILVSSTSWAGEIPSSIKDMSSQEVVSVPGGMEGKVSLNFKNIDVVDALNYLAMKAGINIVVTKMVAGRISLSVKDVPIKDVFDVILRSNGLAYDKRGDIYNVMTEKEYKALYGKDFSDVRQVKVFRIKYAIPEQIFSLLDAMKTEIGKVIVDPESGSVLVMDVPLRLKEMEEAINTFDKRTMVKVFDLSYSQAKDVEKQLKNFIDAKKVGYIRANESTNQVVVLTLPERMRQVEELIKRLDKKTKEVFIDAKIVKVRFVKELDERLEWEGLFDIARSHGLTYLGSYPFSAVQTSDAPWRSRKTVWQGGTAPDGTSITGTGYVGSYPFSGTTSNYSASKPGIFSQALHLGVVGKHDFDIFYRFLEDIGETQVITTPKIVIANNKKAKIHVGEKQAYVTTTTTTGQTTATVAEEVTFIDVGTILNITPTINDEGFITLDLDMEISSVVSELVTPTGNKIPIIGTSKADTKVMVKDGTTVVIGGLRTERKSNTITKTPVLGDIPIIGRLFKSRNPSKERSEMLIMLTPHIISGEVLIGEGGRPVGQEGLKSTQLPPAKSPEAEVAGGKLGLKGLK